MSTKTKQTLIRRCFLFSCFGVEFTVAFLCIVANSMICYGVLAVCGVVLPAYFQNLTK